MFQHDRRGVGHGVTWRSPPSEVSKERDAAIAAELLDAPTPMLMSVRNPHREGSGQTGRLKRCRLGGARVTVGGVELAGELGEGEPLARRPRHDRPLHSLSATSIARSIAAWISSRRSSAHQPNRQTETSFIAQMRARGSPSSSTRTIRAGALTQPIA